jgi:hypothetical protein
MDKSSSLGMSMSPQEISKRYKRQSLGMPKVTPSSSTKTSGHLSRHYIFVASYAMCCSWSVFIFCFQFYFVLFAVINGWTPTYFFWRRHTPFSLPRTLVFTLIILRVFSFATTAFSFCFSPLFLFRTC